MGFDTIEIYLVLIVIENLSNLTVTDFLIM